MRECGSAARRETEQAKINLASRLLGRMEYKTMRQLSSNSLVFGNLTISGHLPHMVKVCTTPVMEHSSLQDAALLATYYCSSQQHFTPIRPPLIGPHFQQSATRACFCRTGSSGRVVTESFFRGSDAVVAASFLEVSCYLHS